MIKCFGHTIRIRTISGCPPERFFDFLGAHLREPPPIRGRRRAQRPPEVQSQRRRRPQADALGHLVDRLRGRLQTLLRGQHALMVEPSVGSGARLVAEPARERPR